MNAPPRSTDAGEPALPALPTLARVAVGLALAVAVALVFAPAVGYGFVEWDDPVYVSRNPQVMGGLTREGVVWAWTTRHAANWHPLAWMSHMLDVELFGAGPRGPHLVNVALHVANALLALALYWRLDPCRPALGAIAAALFALHPLRVESVAWVAERKDVLCVLFSLLAALAYLAWRRRGGAVRYVVVTLVVAAALAAKPMAVTLPLLFLLFDLWPLGGEAGSIALRPRLLEKLPWALLATGAALATMAAQRGGGAVAAPSELALDERLANAALAVPRYLALTLRPAGHSVLYPHPWLPGGVPPPAWTIVAAAVGVAIATALAVRALLARRTGATPAGARPVAMGWLWFLAALLPTLGLVQVGEQALADRYSYLPHVGLLLALVWGVGGLLARVAEVAPRLARGLAALLAVVCVALAAARATAQLPAWSSSEELFRRSLATTPRNPVLLYHLARVRLLAGDASGAEPLLREAVALRPRFAEPHRLLGLVEESRGRLAEAARALDLAVGMVPDYVEARLDLARVLLDLGATARAEAELSRLLAALPDSPQAHYELGRLRSRQGRAAEAERAWQEAARLAPDWAEPRRALERARGQAGSTAR